MRCFRSNGPERWKMADYTEEEIRAMIAEGEAEAQAERALSAPQGMDEVTSNRVFRSNMFRRLDKIFNDFEVFTPEQAAERLNYRKKSQINNYLMLETTKYPHGRIRRGPTEGTYMIIDPFAGV